MGLCKIDSIVCLAICSLKGGSGRQIRVLLFDSHHDSVDHLRNYIRLNLAQAVSEALHLFATVIFPQVKLLGQYLTESSIP